MLTWEQSSARSRRTDTTDCRLRPKRIMFAGGAHRRPGRGPLRMLGCQTIRDVDASGLWNESPSWYDESGQWEWP